MPTRDANGNFVYSQSEYEHLNFIGERFSGFVEGIGYTCTDIVIETYAFNASGTHFMNGINYAGYTFDMGDLFFDDEPTLSNRDRSEKTPDRSDYLRIPNVSKFEYQENWYHPLNGATFVDNIVIDLVNPIIDLLNGPIVSTQIGFKEGFDPWWDNEIHGAKALINAPVDYVKNTYNYTVNTPFSQQMSDLGRDMSNPHNWESGIAMGIGMYYGGRGLMPKAQTKLSAIPDGAAIPKLDYPVETTKDGFLFRGFNIKSPINLPAQRFGQLNINYTDYWGIQTGSNKFLTRRFYAIKPLWNNLTQYTTGTIPKGTSIKIGFVGPQSPFYKYPGGSIQIIVKSKDVIGQTTKIVNNKK